MNSNSPRPPHNMPTITLHHSPSRSINSPSTPHVNPHPSNNVSRAIAESQAHKPSCPIRLEPPDFLSAASTAPPPLGDSDGGACRACLESAIGSVKGADVILVFGSVWTWEGAGESDMHFLRRVYLTNWKGSSSPRPFTQDGTMAHIALPRRTNTPSEQDCAHEGITPPRRMR